MNLKELSNKESRFVGGHTLCPGCGEGIIARAVLQGINEKVVVGSATSCLEVSTSKFPQTSWKCSFIHNAFENVGATVSGVETAYKVLKRKGKVKDDIKFVAFAGDGGLYDIGFQSFSGALERGHNILFICLDNEAYQNTGIQRSSATPYGAWTTTSQVGVKHVGKEQFRKDIVKVAVAHEIPYTAQASPSHYLDLVKKVNYGVSVKGPSFVNVLSPCVPGWKYLPMETIHVARRAVDSCFWPLFEVFVEDGVEKWKLNYDPKDKKEPVINFLKMQGRFKHLWNDNKDIVDKIQANIDHKWEELKRKCNA